MSDKVMEMDGVSVDYVVQRYPWGSPRELLRAVDGVGLELYQGETLGIVGESGSGKSTLARAVMGLEPRAAGTISILGQDTSSSGKRRAKSRASALQMVFQDPYSSLNPSMTAGSIVGEPLRIHEPKLSRSEYAERVSEAMHLVDLQDHHSARYPSEFSGGQRQRLAIARALILRPSVIICDEAVSSLDVSTQGNILRLLTDIQSRLGSAYLFIAHDLPIVRIISDRIAVMYLGRVVETGDSARVTTRPAHPYTYALQSAVPSPHPGNKSRGIKLAGEIPSPLNPPAGCRFHTRCPYVMDICRTERPQPFTLADGGYVECHLHTEGPRLDGAPIEELDAADLDV